MKKTTSPKTKVFNLTTSSFVMLLSAFNLFRNKEHTSAFKNLIMTSLPFKQCCSLDDFKPPYLVKSVEIILHYE